MNSDRIKQIFVENQASVRALALKLLELQSQLEADLTAEGADPAAVFVREAHRSNPEAVSSGLQEIAAMRLGLFVGEYFALVAERHPRQFVSALAASHEPVMSAYDAAEDLLRTEGARRGLSLADFRDQETQRGLSEGIAQKYREMVAKTGADLADRCAAHAFGEPCGDARCEVEEAS